MTNLKEKATPEVTISPNDIINYLRDHPEFLQNNPEALDLLLPPKKRPKRGEVADFQSYMIDRLKADKEEVLQTTREIVENSRANMNNQARIHQAVLRLLEATSLGDFIHCLTMDLSSILNVDIATFLVEAEEKSIPNISNQGIRILPEGTIDKWMGVKPVMLEENISGIEPIYGGGATLVKSQILLRIDIDPETPPALMAFGSRDPLMFNENQATDQILFLARVIERTFRHWLIV
ncbi:MAG: DUF484 family protein [Micavibrio sp.]|nr:DUF484 family protein [Micavibrio sp.]